MAADVKLLPLPEWAVDGTVADDDLPQRIQDYARANVLHHTATQAAEIEALRAEVEMLRGKIDEARVELLCRHGAITAEQARAERLAEALRFMRERFARHMDDTDRIAISALLRDQEEGK